MGEPDRAQGEASPLIDTPKSTEDRIELHNQAVLIRSAQEKLRDGKKLTTQETKAIANAEARKKREAAEQYLRNMPKKDAIALFGGDNRRWCEWSRQHEGCDWDNGAKFVDAVKLMRWMRDIFAETKLRGVAKPNTAIKAPACEVDLRKKLAQAKEAEIKVEKLQGRLIPIDEVQQMFLLWAGEIRTALENLSSEAQRVITETMDNIEAKYEQSVTAELIEVSGGADEAQDTADAS